MAMLNVHNLCMQFGVRTLFQNVTLDVEDRDKIGLVGINGAGKSTLFKIIMGELAPTSGEFFKSKQAVIGYLEQHTCQNPERSVYEELLSVFEDLQEIERQLEIIGAQLMASEEPAGELIEKQAFLTEQLERSGGLTYVSRTRATLLGLGFTEQDFSMETGKLSGGQRSKLCLAKLLLSNANFLLLDEPTNHLDIPSVEWLEGFIKDFKGAVLIVSHDRYFLDKITNKIFELDHQRVEVYRGNYSQYLEKKEQRQEAIRRQYELDLKEIERIEGIIAQQRQWNKEKNIKTAESKQKVVDRIRENLVVPETENAKIRFDFSPRRVSGNDVLIGSSLSMAFGEKQLYQNVNLHIQRGDKVFLLGANGCGKTTLFKQLLGEYALPPQGEVVFGAKVDTGYFDQVQGNLHMGKTAMDEVWDTFPDFTQTEIRNALAAFLFRGDDVYKRVAELSGGERARISLLKLMLHGSNFLLLDEPTNHLDTASREALEDTLLQYSGTMLIISHDRYFINKMANKVLALKKDGLETYLGNYDYYLEKTRENPVQQQSAMPREATGGGTAYKQKKERESAKRKLTTRVARAEEKIEQLEKEAEEVNKQIQLPEVTADFEKLMEYTQRLHALQGEQEAAYEEWESLQEELLRLESANS